VTAWDTFNDCDLILKSWERSIVGKFNLSHACVTSANAPATLFDLQESDPALYKEIISSDDDVPDLERAARQRTCSRRTRLRSWII
jgi:hypothetical protein